MADFKKLSSAILTTRPPMQDVYDAIYPIGSQYIGFSAPIVPAHVNASWVIDASYDGKAIWIDSAQEAGTELSGSLPNIYGWIWQPFDNTVYGAFTQGGGGVTFKGVASGSGINGRYMNFNAKTSNSIYSAAAGANVVRPTSVVAHVWKREA